MSDETTTEQLAEIEGQAADTPTTEYTPPEGWRVLAVGELVMLDDQWVRQDGSVWRSMGTEGPVSEGSRYIRRIKPEPVQVREGRWRTRHGDIRNVTPTPAHDSRATRWPWRDAKYDQTWREDGGCHIMGESPSDLVEYLGPIEEQAKPQPQPEPEPEPDTDDKIRRLQAAINNRMKLGGASQTRVELQGRIRELETIRDTQAATIVELRSEVSYVQRLLGESRQRVTQLEELVASLRTINDAQEKTVRLAGQENTDLQHRLSVVADQWALQAGNISGLQTQLAAVKAELVTQAETSRRLQIELDAAQQVPADSPELRQLRLDLAEVTQDRDTYARAHERVLSDLETIRETTKAEAVEAIAEWLQPIKGAIDAADNQDELARAGFFAIDTIRHLPAIMRSLTGLAQD